MPSSCHAVATHQVNGPTVFSTEQEATAHCAQAVTCMYRGNSSPPVYICGKEGEEAVQYVHETVRSSRFARTCNRDDCN